jgi:hypothetical protein
MEKNKEYILKANRPLSILVLGRTLYTHPALGATINVLFPVLRLKFSTCLSDVQCVLQAKQSHIPLFLNLI